jgi:hypothetical protein
VDVLVFVSGGAIDHLDLIDVNQDAASHCLSPLSMILGSGENSEDPTADRRYMRSERKKVRESGKDEGERRAEKQRVRGERGTRTDLADLERETP